MAPNRYAARWAILVERYAGRPSFALETEESLQARARSLERRARNGAKLLGVARLAIDRAHLVRKYHAFDDKARRDRHFQLVASALGTPPMRRNGADHGKAYGALQRLNGHHQCGPASLF